MKYSPMLAVLGTLDDLKRKDFIYEPKLDGYRAVCVKDGSVLFYSRRGNDITMMFPELRLKDKIRCDSCVLDGEIIIYDEAGLPNFNLMQSRADNPAKVEFPATFVAFDILEKDGHVLTDTPLLERKKILDDTVIPSARLEKTFFTSDGSALYKEMEKRGMEGVVAKKVDGRYIQSRSADWIKIKFIKTIDCVIIGYSSKKRAIASLALGLYGKGGLYYIGSVGTGFTEAFVKELLPKLEPLKVERLELGNVPERKDIWFVKPGLVCEVNFSEFTRTERLRAPSFTRLRTDKRPEDCTMDQLKN